MNVGCGRKNSISGLAETIHSRMLKILHFRSSSHAHANMLGMLTIVLSAVFQFLLTPVIKKYLGAEGLGLWHLIFQTYVYLQLLDIGLSNSIVREIAYCDTGDGLPDRDVYSTSRFMLFGVGLLFLIIGTLCGFIAPKIIKFPPSLINDYTNSVIMLSCWGFFRYYLDLPRLSLRGLNKLVLFNRLMLIDGCGRPFIGLLFLLFTKSIIGLIVGYILVELSIRIIAFKNAEIKKEGGFNRQCFSRLIKFGSGASVARLASLLIFYNSSFIIGWKLDVASIAIFQCSIALPLLFYRFAIVPFTNLLPSLVRFFCDGGVSSMRTKGIKPHLLIIFSSSICYFIVILTNEIFVKYWVGTELYGGYLFTTIYSVFCIVSIVRHNGYIMLQAQGTLKLIGIAHLTEIPLNIILSVILVNNIGLTGIPLACLVSHLPVLLISQLPFYKLQLVKMDTG